MKKPTFPYEKIGEVYICRDSSNVIIQTKNVDGEHERFLVTSEFIELMEPTKPCFQKNMRELRDRMEKEQEDQKK